MVALSCFNFKLLYLICTEILGHFFEFTAVINQSNLRYLSVKRPMCGLTERYMIDGPHSWRDFMSPVQILEEWCLANGIPVPTYSSDGKRAGVNGEMFSVEEFEKHALNYEDTTV